MMRVGMGYDVHRLVKDRELILGGVKIPYERGLLGHSDADVLLHAVMDALLGAAALGDIGQHFPDTDPKYKGISSIELLKRVGSLIEDQLYVIGNIDATIIAQRPKMAPYIGQMRENIAQALHLETGQVNIKATTEEGLGFTGTGEGISAQAVACLHTIANYSYAAGTEEGRCEGCGGCPHRRGLAHRILRLLRRLNPQCRNAKSRNFAFARFRDSFIRRRRWSGCGRFPGLAVRRCVSVFRDLRFGGACPFSGTCCAAVRGCSAGLGYSAGALAGACRWPGGGRSVRCGF